MAIQKNVARLEIAMKHAFFVRVMNRSRDLHHERCALAGMLEQRTARLEQAAGRRVRHCVKGKTVRRLAYPIDGNDVRVFQARGCLRFSPETRHEMIRIAVVNEDTFERDDPVRMRFACLINHSHSAARQLLKNFVIRDVPVAVPGFHA